MRRSGRAVKLRSVGADSNCEADVVTIYETLDKVALEYPRQAKGV